MAEFDPNSFLEQEKSSEFNPDSFLEQEGVKKKESTELSSGLPQYVAAPKSTSESGSGVLDGIEPSMDNLRVMDNYVTPQTETPQQKSERLNSALTPNAKAQKNYIVAKTKYDELISNHSANPIEVDQIAKQVDYFQSRLEKPQTKENDIADEVASVLYSFNKSVSDNVVTPIAGAINLMEDLESGGGIFKKPNRTLSKTVGDVSKYYDKVSEENQPQTIVGKTAAATASAIPLIALTTMTGAGTLPFVIGGQKALTEYGNEPNKPMSLKAEEATEALGEGIKEGLEIEASMMVGGAFGKAVSQELNLGKWGSATARGVGVGAAFALPDFAKVAVENKSLDAPDKEETFVSFATGLAFEAPKFFGLIKNAVSENKVERAAKIQNLDIYNTVFSAPLEAVSEAVEIPQSSELIYKRASSFLKKENPTNEDKIAFQALTRTAGVKDLVDVIISNPEKAKEQISSSDLTPEQKSEFRKRITEINQYFNPIEVRKTELSDEIELAQKTLSDLPEPQTPIDRAENAVLTEKLQETIKKSEQELTDLVRGQIDEAMNPKVEKDGNINLEQQVEPAPPVKVEGVGEGAEVEATKESELKKLEDELAINLAKAEKESDAKPIIKTKRADGTIDTNSIRENAIQAANSLYEYGVKRVNEKYAAQEVKPKTEAPESGSVGVGGDVVKPTFENVPILTRTAEEIETAKNEVFNNLNRLEVGSVIENSDGEIKVVTEKSTDKKGNQLIGIVTYERQSDGSLRQMTNIVWASKSADGKIKLDYNPHSTGTNLKGERVTVTDQITDKKIDLSKENIFTEDENGNLIQINKVEPSLKETPKAGSVGVGGDVEATAKKIVGESAFDKLKKEGYTIEKGKFDSDAYASFFGLHTGVQADEFANAGLRLVKPSEKIKVYRGKGKNVSEGENEGVTWVAEDKKVAENYSNDGNVEEIEVTKPKNPFPNPTDTIHVKGSDVGNKLKGILNRLFREGKVTKEQAIEASKAIDEFVLAAGEESELYSTKTNKKGVSSKYVKALQALGFDGIVQKESYNSGSPFTATKTGNETNTYGIFKAVEQSLKETPKADSVGVGGDVGNKILDLLSKSDKKGVDKIKRRSEVGGLSIIDAAKEYLENYPSISGKGKNRFEELELQAKAVEQSLKETPKAETPTPKGNTSNEEKRGDALERIGVDRQAPDGLQRKEWKEARDYDLGRAISIVENQLNANPNSKIGSIPMNAANAIRAELEMVGVKTTDKTPLSEIIDKIKAVEQSLKETPKAETPKGGQVSGQEGGQGEVKFTSDVSIPFTYKLIESDNLQASHLPSGERNPEHLIASAQPKERNDLGSRVAQDKIAANPNLKEVGENVNAYSGAPIINERGEVIQGNNRSIGLKKHYENGGISYKEQLLKDAEKFGLTKEQVEGMKNPILVRELKVGDQEAIKLGQHDVKDLETGGKQSIDAIATSRKISPKDKSKLTSILFGGDFTTLKDAIRENSKAVANLIKGYINPAQFRNTFNSDGSFTAKGMDDISNVVTHFLFEDGDAVLPEVFDGLPSNIQKGIQKALPHILSLDKSNSLISDIQKSMLALHDFYSSKNENFDEWANTIDMFTGESPNKIFTPIEITIAKKLHAATKQVDIKNIFQKYEELVNGREANLIDEAVDGLSKKEAIEKQFKIKYDENKQEPNTKPESKTDDEKPAASKDKNGERKESGEGENREGSNDGDNEVSKGRQLFDYLTKQGQNAKDAALNVRLFALNAKRRAQILGKSVREVLDEYQFGDESKKDKKSGLNNETGTRGSWSKDKGKRLLNIYKNAKNKTLVHEVLGHDYLDTIIEASKGGHAESSADIEVIVREFKKQNKTSKTEKQLYDALNNFNVESIDRKVDADAISVHEWFAKAAEKYMANPDMKGISPRLKRLFDKFITYLKDLHNDLAGTQVSEPMREIFRKAFGDEFDNAQKIIDEIDSDLAQRINNDSSEDALFSDIDTDFVEGENELNSIDLPQRTKDVLLTAARKLFEKGATSSTIIAQMKAKAANTPRSEAKINEIIDSLSKEIQAQGEFEFDGKFLPRAGAEKMLENENIPAELRAYIRKNKNVRGYKPTTIAEMDAMADIIISHLGEDAAADWATTLDKKDSKFASPQYKARVYKKITDSLYEKYIKLKETDAEKAEDVYDKYIKIVRDGLKSQTETAQLLASYRGVNGWGEFTVRDAEREIAKENAGKISKASTTFKQIAEAFKKKDEAINELMEKNFALEESLEAKSDKIAELESEQKTRTSKDRPLTNGTPKFSNPTEKKAELIAKLKASRASKGLKDEDSDNLKDYARVIMEEAKNTFSFSKFSKLARKDVGDFTDLELREAYESARDEMINDGFDDKFDNSEIIDKLIEENIVRDEDLKAKIEAKRLEKEAAQALKEWEIFEKEMAQKNKKTASEENRERILEKKYLDAEKRRLEKEAKSEQSLFNKSASTRIKQAKADVLEELKSAGYKKGNSVDWAKIAVERQQNPKEVERIIIETINKAKGLTVNEKNNLKQELLTKLDESIKESQRKKVEQALKDNGAKNTNNKGDIDKIVELVNSSPNAKEADIVKAFEKLFNIKSLPKKDAQRILELGKALQEETMRKERKKIIDEMTFLATKHSGSRIGRIIMDGMYASKLSGWLTQMKNATNRLNVWEQVIGSLARSGDRNYSRVLAKSRKRGIFGDTVNSGISLSKSTVGTDRYGNSTHVNELEHLADTPKWFRNTYGQQKYVGRFLDAIDGENWLRALDQSQYKYMVRQLKTKGYSDKAARNKAFEIMYPISEKEATESAQKYFSDKGQNIVGDNELKRAAYDIMRQNRESKAESLGISNLDKVGEMFADLLTFKGDAVGGTGDKKSFELSMWAASHVKGGFEAMNKYADKSGKIPKAVSALIKFEMAPFIDGIARIMERSAESALFGVGGFAKGMYQKNFAKSLDAGEGKILAEMQAEETLTRATGTLIMQIAATASIVYLNKLLLSAMGEEEDPEKNGFKGSRLFGKKSDEQKPGDVLMLLNGRVNIPFEYMGTLMLSAGLVGNIMDYTKSEDATASGVVLNTVNTALGASMFGSESKSLNWLKEIEKASKENGTFSEATHKALERQTAQLVTDFIPFRSFVKQTSDLYNNATDKESRSVLDNVLKYTISGYGLDDKIDYRGRLIKMGKKYPGGASGLREAFNESQYDDWDKLIGELGDMDFSQRPIDKITQFKMPLTDKEYYEYTKDVKTEFGNQLTDKKYFEIIKMKADKENHKSAEEVQRDAVNDIFKEAKKTIDKRFKIKNEWGEDFY